MKRKQKRMLKKLLVLFAIASILVLNLGSYASAASLADVSLFEKVDVDATLGNVAGTDPYTLKLNLSATDLADIELVNPDKTAVFYAEELKDLWNKNGTAHVRAELLPITLEDLSGVLGPVLTTVDGVVDTLTTTVGGLTPTLNALLSENGLTGGLITVEGLDELNDTIAALGNIDEALVEAIGDILVYEDDIEVVQGENGEFTVTFSDGLGSRLATTINGVVLGLVNQVVAQVDALNVKVDLSGLVGLEESLLGQVVEVVKTIPIIGTIITLVPVDPLVDTVQEVLTALTADLTIDANALLAPVKTILKDTVTPLVATVANTVLGLLDELLSLQVLGETTVDLNLTIDKPTGINGDVKVYGAVVNDSVLDLPLLSSLVDYDIISFNETTPGTPPGTTPTTPDGGTKLPTTSAGILSYGLLGLGTLVAGVGTRFYAKRK